MKSCLCARGIKLIRSMLVSVCVLVTHFSHAQTGPSKLSPTLLNELKTKSPYDNLDLSITVKNDALGFLRSQFKTQQLYTGPDFSVFRVSATTNELFTKILLLPGLHFIETGNRIAREELIIGNLDLSVNKINLAHRNFSSISGEGTVVSVKENLPDTTDIDFRGRFLPTNLSSTSINSHASVMATMIAGGGNSWHLGKGVASGSTISSSSFAVLLPDANSAYQQYNISVQNHSYGVGVESYYGADAAAYDASAITNPALLHIFSSGNSGTSAATDGTYSGLPGFANLTGSFKMAKNILTVGATDSFSIVAPLSSKGPAHDGRVKPELVAFGEDGSSGAAALVSGTALLLQHFHKQSNGSLPSNTLIKVVLINSADDVGNAELDYQNGYGALNANSAIKTLHANRFFSGNVSNSTTQSFNIIVPGGIKKLKATLAWNDPPATPNTTKALINDLDLEMVHPSSGQTWQPWVLNSFPHSDSLDQLAKRERDTLNNVEQITISDPVAGNYQLQVIGTNITASQNFHIAWQLDSADSFEWQFPAANDFIFPGRINTIRWHSSFAATAGTLEYNFNGNGWQQIQNHVDPGPGHFYWNAPPVTGTAQLRMTIGSNVFVSDTFTIASRTITGVGFNCLDSFLIYWNKLPAVTDYRIYKLGNKYLEPLTVTADSFLILAKSAHSSLHYAAAPVIGNKEGVKSYTFNYTTQGVECYIRSFVVFLAGNTGELTVTLGTLYNVDRIILERFDGNGFVPVQTITNPTVLSYDFTDGQLNKGVNIYRIKLELTGGRVIYSSTETIYYFKGNEFVVYPNPVVQSQPITILSDNQFEPATLAVLNMQGQKVFEMKLTDISTQIPAGKLSKGVYLLKITRKDLKDVVIKIFVK